MLSVFVNLLRKYRFRRSIRSLVKRGMVIGKGVHIMPRVSFDADYASLISIGDNCIITSGVTILAHDASLYPDLNFAKIGKVEIRNNTFIGVNSIILPGVSIGPNVIVGAGSVVSEDVPENSIVAGNPARIIAKKDEFLKKHQWLFRNSKVIEYQDFFNYKGELLKNLDVKMTYLLGGEKYTSLKWLDDERRRYGYGK